MGHRLDFSCFFLRKDKNKPLLVYLCSGEIKPENVSDDMKTIQLSKNVRVNKVTLNLLSQHMGINQEEKLSNIGVDIIGLQGYFYKVFQYEDVVAALKLASDDIFLPNDEDDLYEFLCSNGIDQFIFFVDHTYHLRSSVKSGTRSFKRARAASNTTCNIQPRLQSPPRRSPPFLSFTFFTLTRTYVKNNKDTTLQAGEVIILSYF